MSPEEFEKQLQQRPLRPMPTAWRAEILGVAKAAERPAARSVPSNKEKVSFFVLIRDFVTTEFKSRPKSMAALAMVWVAIMAMHFSTHDDSRVSGRRVVVSPATLAEVREQREFFAELAGLREKVDVEPPRRVLPRPHSERQWMQAA
jgi:hypothetical protein